MEACYPSIPGKPSFNILFTRRKCLPSCCCCRHLHFYANAHPLLTHILYFISISFLGFLALKLLPRKDPHSSSSIHDLDLFFTSVSAATVSSMSTVEMEAFSNSQLIVLTILMLVGGEVVTSTIGLLFKKQLLKLRSMAQIQPNSIDRLESGIVPSQPQQTSHREEKLTAMKRLVYVLIGYLVSVHLFGSVAIAAYMSIVSSARDILRGKNLNVWTFSVFTTVSSFSSCGFIPTNENMIVFRKNTVLLLLIVPLVLIGNTLFPPSLRFIIWVFKRLTKRSEYDYLLEGSRETIYYHLLPRLHSVLLIFTVAVFTVIQILMICFMEWNSQVFAGMSSYQKVTGALFLSVNSRHTGESVVDLSAVSQAILVLFVVMMYLPPYTTFLPIREKRSTSSNIVTEDHTQKRMSLMKSFAMSQLSYLVIFVILVCITEKRKLVEDPLNFSVLNIVVEVISAYGNVGFSTGYSCKRQLKPDGDCKDVWYGFVGKWSSRGKAILILVMFFGRLKKFGKNSGKAWKLC